LPKSNQFFHKILLEDAAASLASLAFTRVSVRLNIKYTFQNKKKCQSAALIF